MNSISIFHWKNVVGEVSEIEVYDDIIKEGIVFECLVVCQAHCHAVLGSNRELTELAVVSQHSGGYEGPS